MPTLLLPVNKSQDISTTTNEAGLGGRNGYVLDTRYLCELVANDIVKDKGFRAVGTDRQERGQEPFGASSRID